MARKYSNTTPDFLRSEDEFPCVGRMVTDADGTALMWRAARQLQVRLYEVRGWLGRAPQSYLCVHPEDLAKLPVNSHSQARMLGLPIGRIHRRALQANRTVVRAYIPEHLRSANAISGFLSMHFMDEARHAYQ